VLSFEENAVDVTKRWTHLQRGAMEIGLIEGEPEEDGAVGLVDVPDVKLESERLRAAGVEVGIVVELTGQMRLLDVYDPDGNRVQFAQEL
jgi:hypothetical protein